jgi:Domain of unknown function (DUF4124)
MSQTRGLLFAAALSCALSAIPSVTHAGVLRCVDRAGKVHYTDGSAAGDMACAPLNGRAGAAPAPLGGKVATNATSSVTPPPDRAERRKAPETELGK